MHAQLVGPARARRQSDHGKPAQPFLDGVLGPARFAGGAVHHALGVHDRVLADGDGLVDRATVLLEFAPANRLILFFDFALQDGLAERLRGGLIFRDDDQAARFAVETVDHAGSGHAVVAQPVGERAVLGTLRRVADHPARFVYHEHVVVFEDNPGWGVRERVHGAC